MWKRYLSPTPANVARLLIGIKSVLGIAAGGSMVAHKPVMAFWIMVIIGAVNEAATFLTEKQSEDKPKEE
jgi:hypothetical protein